MRTPDGDHLYQSRLLMIRLLMIGIPTTTDLIKVLNSISIMCILNKSSSRHCSLSSFIIVVRYRQIKSSDLSFSDANAPYDVTIRTCYWTDSRADQNPTTNTLVTWPTTTFFMWGRATMLRQRCFYVLIVIQRVVALLRRHPQNRYLLSSLSRHRRSSKQANTVITKTFLVIVESANVVTTKTCLIISESVNAVTTKICPIIAESTMPPPSKFVSSFQK